MVIKRVCLALLLTAAALVSLRASSPKFFQAATQSDFLKGEVQNLSIDTRGQLTLGPASELVYETAAPFLWSLIPGPDGSLFIGTGNEGRVFRVDGDGKGTSFFDSAELEAHALAPAPDGGLFVGSSPDGKIYKVDRKGVATTFFEPDEKYIWAMTVDAKGNLYAATGEKGIIYRIGPDGTGTRFYQAKATHATSLAFDRSGNLLVGTESPGRVLRVDPTGKAFVLLDSPFQEIRALRFDDKGMLYVAAVSGRTPSGGSRPAEGGSDRPASESSATPIASVSTEITSIAVADVSSSSGSSTPPRPDSRSPRGAIYRIAPDGLWDQLWESREDAPYDLIFDAEGRLIVGTGNKGKIYRLDGDPLQPTLLVGAGAQQVTAFYKDAKNRLYFATANPGKLFRLSTTRAARGTYESEPRDAQTVATWGALRWRGSTPTGAGIEISTRTGNTATPDDTWSPWSAAYTIADGSAITSPKARFIQWRVTLSGKTDSPVLTSISAAYLQRNLRPQVRSITVHPPGIVFQKPFTTGDPDLAGFENQTTPERTLTNAAMNSQQSSSGSPALGRRTYQKGLQTLIWRAEDENDDDLSYEIRYRREGETAWKVLRHDVTEPILVWDTTTVPNGTYFVRIVASDSPSNATDTALSGESDSNAFDIDNTPPEIKTQPAKVDGSRTIVTFAVTDDHSPIQRVECSQDGMTWRPIFPRDGIADSKSEQYEVAIDGELGPRGLSLRVTDAMNNVATSQVSAPVRTR
jgi:sugar lactone lactonase YvrE